MNFSGIIVGAATFLIIGICHPIVIKMEYHWGKGSWWILLVAGLAFSAASIFVNMRGSASQVTEPVEVTNQSNK